MNVWSTVQVTASTSILHHSCFNTMRWSCVSCPRQLIETVKSMANTMLFRQLTFERQMVTFSLLTIRGVSRHSFIQVPMWRKGPNDHLPLVWTTMGCTLLKCAEGAWPLWRSRRGWGESFITGRAWIVWDIGVICVINKQYRKSLCPKATMNWFFFHVSLASA